MKKLFCDVCKQEIKEPTLEDEYRNFTITLSKDITATRQTIYFTKDLCEECFNKIYNHHENL